MSKYAHASQVSTPSRVLLPILFLGSIAPLMRKYEFLKTLHLLLGLLFNIHAIAAEGEQQIALTLCRCQFKGWNFHHSKGNDLLDL